MECGMAITVVELSQDNKRDLLSEALARLGSRQAEAVRLLWRLRELSPELGSQFTIKDNDVTNLRLRMLKSSSVNIVHNKSTRIESYIAISYCWHNDKWQTAPSAGVSNQWGISESIMATILALRCSEDEGIWMDTACIHQSDEAEKRVAVGFMDLIYNSCRRIIIVMEDVMLSQEETAVMAKYEDAFEKCLSLWRQNNPEGETVDFLLEDLAIVEEDLTVIESAMMKICHARWYSRAWCAHESRMRKHDRHNTPVVLCLDDTGSVFSFHWRFVLYLGWLMDYRQMLKPLPGMSLPEMIIVLRRKMESTWHRFTQRSNHLQPNFDPRVSLLYYMNSMMDFDCQELNDLCTIALNNASVPIIYTGNISSLAQIRTMSTILAIAAGDITPLLLNGTKFRIANDDGELAISWVELLDFTFDEPRILSPFMSTITAANENFIELDLMLVVSGSLQSSTQAIEAASVLMKKHPILCKLHHPDNKNYYMDPTDLLDDISEKNGLQTQWSQAVLAYALDCGLPWILKFADAVEKDLTSKAWTFDDQLMSDSQMIVAATDLLSHFGITRTATTQLDLTFLPFLSPVLRFLIYFTHSKLRAACRQSLCIRTNCDGDYALTEGYHNISWIAIPCATSHLCAKEHRAWLIEPHDPACPAEEVGQLIQQDYHSPSVQQKLMPFFNSREMGIDQRLRPNGINSWKLRSKQALIGCGPIKADGKSIILLKKQRVYGAEAYDSEALYGVMKEITEARSVASTPLD